MNQLLNNKYFNILIFPLFFIFGQVVSNLMNYTMFDDGWRHLAMAFYKDEMGSWGELLFTLYIKIMILGLCGIIF